MPRRHEYRLRHVAQVTVREGAAGVAPVKVERDAGATLLHVVGHLGRGAVQLRQFQRGKAVGNFHHQRAQHLIRQRLV
ncbi:hypothetical protein D3C71_1819530 [compost metagenome]